MTQAGQHQDSPAEGAREVRPAATLILMRPRAGGNGDPDILMLQRARSMAFAAGAVVFPGGAVDPGDQLVADALDHGLDPEDAAARVAAIRETIEEAGVAAALTRELTRQEVAAVRAALVGGANLAEALAAHDTAPVLDDLIPFARWCPGKDLPSRHVFDTRFYVAHAPGNSQDAQVDATENLRMRWSSASDMLADVASGVESAIFPTICNLQRLTLVRSVEETVAFMARYPLELVSTWIEERDGEPHICIPDHLGYPVTSRPVRLARRL